MFGALVHTKQSILTEYIRQQIWQICLCCVDEKYKFIKISI